MGEGLPILGPFDGDDKLTFWEFTFPVILNTYDPIPTKKEESTMNNLNAPRAIGEAAVRITAAGQVINKARELSHYADALAERAKTSLAPIMRREEFINESQGKVSAPLPELPPLFDELRAILQSIEHSLQVMDSTLDKVEV
jgi:hypothetical protein